MTGIVCGHCKSWNRNDEVIRHATVAEVRACAQEEAMFAFAHADEEPDYESYALRAIELQNDWASR